MYATINLSREKVETLREVNRGFDFQEQLDQREPQYNVAPTQKAPVPVLGDDGLELKALRWGLVPTWAKDFKIGARAINARVETVAERLTDNHTPCASTTSTFIREVRRLQNTLALPSSGSVMGNVKRAVSGCYHALRQAKYALRYLAEAAYRFNRRFRLAESKRPPAAPSPNRTNPLHYAPDTTGAKRWARRSRVWTWGWRYLRGGW